MPIHVCRDKHEAIPRYCMESQSESGWRIIVYGEARSSDARACKWQIQMVQNRSNEPAGNSNGKLKHSSREKKHSEKSLYRNTTTKRSTYHGWISSLVKSLHCCQGTTSTCKQYCCTNEETIKLLGTSSSIMTTIPNPLPNVVQSKKKKKKKKKNMCATHVNSKHTPWWGWIHREEHRASQTTFPGRQSHSNTVQQPTEKNGGKETMLHWPNFKAKKNKNNKKQTHQK